MKNFSIDNCEEVANSFEGTFWVEHCNVGKSCGTASSSRTQGPEVYKVCHCPIPLSDPPSLDAYRPALVIGGLGSFPKKISNSLWRFGSEPEGLGIHLGKTQGCKETI